MKLQWLVFALALGMSAWTLWHTIKPRVGQILDALYGRRPHRFQPLAGGGRIETPAQARWRRVHAEADRREKDLAQ